MNSRVEIDVLLPHPPRRVWRALTDPAKLAEWLLPNNFRAKIGFQFSFIPPASNRLSHEQKVNCQVVELETERRLTYSWRETEDDMPDLVTWTLEAVGEGTRLRLVHSGAVPLAATAPISSLASCIRIGAIGTTLWCGAAIRLDRLLANGLIMGRAVPVASGATVCAVSIRRVDDVVDELIGGRVRC